jgi:hypothetical protein
MDPINRITVENGSFSGIVPNKSDLTADSATLSGILSSSTPESIDEFFVFSSPDVGGGTTRLNRFDFDLTSILYAGGGFFEGTGTLYDSTPTGAFAPTAATFTLGFSSDPGDPIDAGNYSFTVAALGTAAVPEPSTIGLVATGLLGLWTFRRRKL